MASDTHSATILHTNETQPSLININVAAQAPLKLTSTNYISWKLQFQTLFIGHDLVGYIDGSNPCPPAVQGNTTTPNPFYNFWIRQDQLILNAIIASISPTIIPFIAQSTTSRQAWSILANTYAKPSRGRIKQLKHQLKHLTIGNLGISEFMQIIKTRADDLALLGAPMDEEDITDKILDGLGDEYRELVRAVQARDSSISFEELHEKLLNFEATLQTQSHSSASPYFPATANPTHRTHNRSWRPPTTRPSTTTPWRPSYHPSYRSTPQPPHKPISSPSLRPSPRPYLGYCQICRIQGHTANRCPSFRLVPIHSAPNQQGPPWQPQAHLATHPPNTPSWLLDSGASHHVTSDLHNLSLHAPYSGSDDIMIGDGSTLPISHTGSTLLTTPTRNLSLDNVLCVPSMKKNLISISQFCISNNISIEFLPYVFLVKDLLTGTILLRGQTRDGVYEWPTSSPFLAFSAVKPTAFEWHHRLGHPAFSILKYIVSSYQLNVSSPLSSNHSCNACQCNKSHKLPFSKSTIVTHRPLEIIFSDVWTSPIISHNGFKYYVIFVDHFTKYIWFYPIKNKSDVKEVFLRFKAIVEKYFETSINTLYTDNGGEYISLASSLSKHGISHLTTPPHTPEHNGYSERRHRHIVETGLALLTHSSIPRSYWNHAFATAVYLISRLPTPTLNFSSPYQKIFSKNPNYSKLRVFG